MIKSLGHVGVGVTDMQRSLEFYRDFLGMNVLMELDITDDRIGRVIGVDGAKCQIVHLELGGTILELFQYHNPQGVNKASDMQQYDKGFLHIGFEVDQFHDLMVQLRERNTPFLGEPVEFRPDVWIAYVKGPDGEVVEFRERPE